MIRATPTLLRPTSARRRSLVRWESRGKTIDPEWLELTAAASELEGPSRTVPTKIPSAATVATLKPQSLVIVAGASRVHHVKRVGGNAAKRLPAGRVETIAGASHYGLPLTHAERIATLILG